MSTNSSRTAGNKLSRVSQWYRDVMKVRPGEGLVTVKDTRMGVVEQEPEVYTETELKAFFEACDKAKGHDGLLFQTFLLTGFREDEIKYFRWDDIDFKTGTIKVTPKPQYDFEIKDHEERTVHVITHEEMRDWSNPRLQESSAFPRRGNAPLRSTKHAP